VSQGSFLEAPAKRGGRGSDAPAPTSGGPVMPRTFCRISRLGVSVITGTPHPGAARRVRTLS
jgi:hypothetical protein